MSGTNRTIAATLLAIAAFAATGCVVSSPGKTEKNPEGLVLGIWIEQTEGAKFWLRVMTELKSRRVADVLIAV